MKGMVEVALFLGAIVFAPTASTLPPGEPPVKYEVPATWRMLKTDGSAGEHRAVTYEVVEGAKPGDHPTVIIKAYERPPGLGVDNIDLAEVARQVVPSGVLVSDADDGASWRTCVFLGRVDDFKVVALYRIGIKDGYVVEEAFIFPLATDESDELALLTVHGQAEQQGRTTGVYAPLRSTYKMVSIFNEFTKTLAINNKGPFKAKVIMAKPEERPAAVYRSADLAPGSRPGGDGK